jgi:S1-C subfamily serine protease
VFHDGDSYSAKVIGADPFADLAVIKVNSDPQALHPLPLGDSSRLRIGDEVIAIGSPFGLTGSMTTGIVSQLGRILNPPNIGAFSIPNVIQTDTAINPGNSGGPLLNDNGEVIGINTAIQTQTGEFSGVGFAIPSNTMKRIIPQLIQNGHYKHPWLGVSGISLDPDLSENLGLSTHTGFLIENIVPDSPASKSGLHSSNQTRMIESIKYKFGGDIIVGVDNTPVKKLEDLLNYLQDNKSAGDKMILKIIRDGKPMEVTLVLQERPSSPPPQK